MGGAHMEQTNTDESGSLWQRIKNLFSRSDDGD